MPVCITVRSFCCIGLDWRLTTSRC
jgi:hypothetical protein